MDEKRMWEKQLGVVGRRHLPRGSMQPTRPPDLAIWAQRLLVLLGRMLQLAVQVLEHVLVPLACVHDFLRGGSSDLSRKGTSSLHLCPTCGWLQGTWPQESGPHPPSPAPAYGAGLRCLAMEAQTIHDPTCLETEHRHPPRSPALHTAISASVERRVCAIGYRVPPKPPGSQGQASLGLSMGEVRGDLHCLQVQARLGNMFRVYPGCTGCPFPEDTGASWGLEAGGGLLGPKGKS
jgi:hypothetical protein